MKKFIYMATIFFLTFSMRGYSQRNLRAERPNTISADSLQYELIIVDPEFDSWLATQPPMNFYSNEYYRQKNIEFVSEWNQRYVSSKRKDLYESYIDYNPNINYPLELNYRLYYYFRYFEEKNHVKLSNSVRH